MKMKQNMILLAAAALTLAACNKEREFRQCSAHQFDLSASETR